MKRFGAVFQTISWRLVVASTMLMVAPATATNSWAQQNGQVFVGNYHSDSATMYPLLTNGNVAPVAVIPDLFNGNPFQIAFNHRTNELIVANNGVGGVQVYDRATGTLKRSLNGPSTGLKSPTGVAVDENRGE